jgi:hypothetical protein
MNENLKEFWFKQKDIKNIKNSVDTMNNNRY